MTKYKSKFEKKIATTTFKHLKYEPIVVQYAIAEKRKYTPDFVIEKGLMMYLVELKGRFRTRDEMNKYLHVRESLPDNIKLIFLFQDPTVALPGVKKRKDGTKMSMGEWASNHGFEWHDANSIRALVEE